MSEDKNRMQIEIDIDDEVAQGVYANLAGVAHGPGEFIMDFLFLQPNAPKAKLRARVISSPSHTKRFLAALSENVRKYEEKNGVIVEPSTPPMARG
ncbi:MAG: DUF3467 domain-containing protein [Elusimicrobiaceae bacterium]|nr:DUF3467 domain-containing protein [Elusimicrobiaceae bacterium]